MVPVVPASGQTTVLDLSSECQRRALAIARCFEAIDARHPDRSSRHNVKLTAKVERVKNNDALSSDEKVRLFNEITRRISK